MSSLCLLYGADSKPVLSIVWLKVKRAYKYASVGYLLDPFTVGLTKPFGGTASWLKVKVLNFKDVFLIQYLTRETGRILTVVLVMSFCFH